MTIEERARKIVVEHLGVDAAQVTPDVRFRPKDGMPHEPGDGHLGCDSLDIVELVMVFEDEFGCSIPDDQAGAVVTFKDAVALIEQNGGR